MIGELYSQSKASVELIGARSKFYSGVAQNQNNC
jgi:hypothetical protein